MRWLICALFTHCIQADAVVISVQLLQVNVDGAVVQEQSSASRHRSQTAEREEEEAGGWRSLHRFARLGRD